MGAANSANSISMPLQIGLLCIIAGLVFVVALSVGSVTVSLHDVITAVFAHDESLHSTIVWQLRLPRALNAFALGGLLALTGVYMQALLRNPLADPFVVGTSGGAAIGALIALLLGLGAALVQCAAMAGAFAATLVVFSLAHAEGSWSPTRLLLTGVVVASGCGAGITLLLALGDESRLRSMVFWLMGDVSNGSSLPLFVLLIASGIISGILARHLNLMSRGEIEAQALGLNTRKLRIALFVLSAILTACVVTRAGTIGFVGLIVPHLARQLFGSDHRRVIPASILLGGILLTLADTAARTLFAPRQLPVGAITALIGVPVFLTLMFARRR
jgi:iron complex transport system permease protein